MSFILDALKKSENERQEQAAPEFATVPSSPDAPAAPRWLWLLGALLAINAVVIVAFALRPQPIAPVARATLPPATSVETTAPDRKPAAAAEPRFAEQIADARRSQPVDTAEPEAATIPRPETIVTEPPPAVSSLALLPSLAELRLDGSVNLPDLHVDIHVYSDDAADRFVFINMKKYRENDRLSEGPRVREITAEGVVLDHRGTAFILPRE